jgi:hypothetical protein
MNMPAPVELSIAEFDRCMIEFQTCYDMVGDTDDFIARCPQARIDSLAAHNPILAQFERQGRTVTAAHLFAGSETPSVEPPTSTIRECVRLDERPRMKGESLGADGSPLSVSVVDPTPGAPGPREVVLNVLVDTDGRVHDATILRGSNAQRDTEAFRTISKLPLMEPGRSKGVATACYEEFPVRFIDPGP